MKKSKLFIFLLIVTLIVLSIIILVLMNMGVIPSIFKSNNGTAKRPNRHAVVTQENPNVNYKNDDWCYEPQEVYEESFGITNSKGFSTATDSVSLSGAVANTESTLGYSVGR